MEERRLGLERFHCMKRNLETERSMKLQAIIRTVNPVEQELLERELTLIDAQISWLTEHTEERQTA